jgi:riboflavin biosynthesis pyrimidine reductase
LLVCGSLAAWQTRQQQCEQAGIPIVKSSDLLVTRAVADLASRGVLVIAWDARSQLSRLAAWVAALMEATPVATVLAEGGATAAAIAEQLGWKRFCVVQTAPSGVGVLQPLDCSDAPNFLIKPGSYAWPDDIWKQLAQP